MTQTDVIEKTDVDLGITKPKKWAIVLHDDNVTPKDFVVMLLIKVFRHTPQRASELMTQVDTEGKAIAGVYSYEIAESKHSEAVQTVQLNGRMLKVTMEEHDS